MSSVRRVFRNLREDALSRARLGLLLKSTVLLQWEVPSLEGPGAFEGLMLCLYHRGHDWNRG